MVTVARKPDTVPDPASAPTYHTIFDGRHYALSVAPGEQFEFDWSPNGKLVLYGIRNGLLQWSWIPLRSDRDVDPAGLDERAAICRPSSRHAISRRSPRTADWMTTTGSSKAPGSCGNPYYRWSEDWDHDHCVFCSATLSLDEPGALTEGYAVQDDPKFGDDYNWICVPCLEERRGLVHYEIIGE